MYLCGEENDPPQFMPCFDREGMLQSMSVNHHIELKIEAMKKNRNKRVG